MSLSVSCSAIPPHAAATRQWPQVPVTAAPAAPTAAATLLPRLPAVLPVSMKCIKNVMIHIRFSMTQKSFRIFNNCTNPFNVRRILYTQITFAHRWNIYTFPFFPHIPNVMCPFGLGDLCDCSVSVQVDASCASYRSGTSHQSGPGCRWCGDGELWGERTRSSIHLEKTLCVSVFVSTCVLYQGPLFCWLVFPALSTWFAAGRKS